ncbi:MAG: hypothetical protein IPL97_00410 [Niastella sp.]|nr:hypothetical protein [Niastella sp.]
MEKHLSAYLFNYKCCPLPGIGSLQVQDGGAFASVSEKKMYAPVPSIHFSKEEIPEAKCIHFLATAARVPEAEAKQWLAQYCQTLQIENEGDEIALADAGFFYINSHGRLSFRPLVIPRIFNPDIDADRVIHPNEAHNMLVGDTHTTNTAMHEYFANDEESENSKWWIGALILAALAAILMIVYFTGGHANANSGNGNTVTPENYSRPYQQQ